MCRLLKKGCRRKKIKRELRYVDHIIIKLGKNAIKRTR